MPVASRTDGGVVGIGARVADPPSAVGVGRSRSGRPAGLGAVAEVGVL